MIQPELVLSISGVVISLLFEYFPCLSRKYNALKADDQKLVMLAVLVVVVCSSSWFSCLGWLSLFKCGDIQALVMSLIVALVANQSTHRVLPKGKG